MNKRAYRLVFSKRLGMLVPVALGLSIVGLGSTSAQTTPLPTGGQVVQGTGSISQTANTLTVNQSTQLLGVTWQSFNIGAGNTVQFVQPNAQSVAINRVLGNDRSEIFGHLKANGQVFLLNPNGVLFGASAQVDVGALVASTARQANQGVDGSWTFSDKGTGQVVNQGHIKAKDGGFVVLDSAAQTLNSGTIQANMGGVALTVAQNTRIALDGQGQLNVNVDGAVLQALVSNQGLILADGGAVHLTARGKNMLLSSVVNQTGVIKARSVQNRNGRIFLSGGDSGKVQVSGTLDVSGKEAGQTGGRIEVTGEHIQISQATLDASGHSAGGSVRIDASASEHGCPHCLRPGVDYSQSHRNGVRGVKVAAEVLCPDTTLLKLLMQGQEFEARRYWRSQRNSPFDSPDMLGKEAWGHALYDVSRGLIDPYYFEKTFGKAHVLAKLTQETAA